MLFIIDKIFHACDYFIPINKNDLQCYNNIKDIEHSYIAAKLRVLDSDVFYISLQHPIVIASLCWC